MNGLLRMLLIVLACLLFAHAGIIHPWWLAAPIPTSPMAELMFGASALLCIILAGIIGERGHQE